MPSRSRYPLIARTQPHSIDRRIRRTNPDHADRLALRASGQVRQPKPDEPSPEGAGGGTRSWQREVWDYYDLVGEFHYSATFVGNCLSRIRLTVALPDSDGVPGPAFDEDGKPLTPDANDALELIRELHSDIAGESQTLRALGLNTFVAGECYLLGQDDALGVRQWEVLSVDELRPKRDKRDDGPQYERVTSPGEPAKDVPTDAVVFRIWQPHPRWSYLADAAPRALRDVLEEIVLLTRDIRGRALSRLAAAGILCVPTEIDYPDDEAASEDADEGDPFTRDLIRTLSTAVSDKATAAAVVPFVLRGPAEYLKEVRHVHFERSASKGGDQSAAAERKESVQRFAQGVDLPVEIVTGHAQTTFSNAWQIDESTYKAHVEAKVQMVVDALTVGYLKPNLPGTALVVGFDASELVAHPDKGEAAQDCYDRFELSGSSLRDAKGFSDSDAPDDEEVQQRVDRAIALKSGGTPPGAGDQGDGGAPGVGPATSGDGASMSNPALSAAAEVAVIRAVERAGARLRSKANGSTLRSILAGIPDMEVGATLGPSRVRQLATEEELFRNEFRALRAWTSSRFSTPLADEVEAWANGEARRRLYAPRIG